MGIQLLRVSFIWAESTLDRLRATKPVGSRWVAPTTAAQYVKMLPDWRTGTGELAVPWKEPTGRSFWKYYTPKQQLDQISDIDAFTVQVPGRARLPWSVSAAWLSGRVDGEIFVFPFGHTLVLTFSLEWREDGASLEDAVATCFQVRRNGSFTVIDENGAESTMDLSALASRALSVIRLATTGDGALKGSISPQPFTISSIIRRTSPLPPAPVVDGDATHLALDGLSSFSVHYPLGAPTPLASALLNPAHLGPAQLLYAAPRGRAIWFPARAAATSDFLGCYHRTLLFLSMQLESLGVAIGDFEQAPETRTASTLRSSAKNVCVHLGRLEGQLIGTFRSPSSPRQIKDAGWLGGLDGVRSLFGMPVINRVSDPAPQGGGPTD